MRPGDDYKTILIEPCNPLRLASGVIPIEEIIKTPKDEGTIGDL